MSVKDHRKTLLKSLILIFICAALVSAPACSSAPSLQKYSVTYTDVFDTVTEFTAYCDSQNTFNEVSDSLHAELLRLHRLYDIYNEYEGIVNLAYMNRVCGESPVKAPAEIVSLLMEGQGWYRLTNGRMNIFAGAVLSLWHKCREKGDRIPAEEELTEASKHVSIESVIIEDGTVFFTDKELKIDAGALAKGHAFHRVSLVLRDSGITGYLLNIGGNVTAEGKKPDGLWKVGVQDPDGGGLYTKVSVSDVSVVTSGDYQRYYEYNGTKYHHIIDLNTLYPASEYRSVTVICRYSWDADALSTALFVMSIEEGERLLQQYEAEALWIKSDGDTVRSDGFSAYE